MKKLTSLILVGLFFLQACGTIFKPNQVNRPHSGRLDITVVALDTLGLFLFVIPGIVAFTVDYMNGTLYLPKGVAKLEDLSPEAIQKTLAKNGFSVSLEDIKKANLAYNIKVSK